MARGELIAQRGLTLVYGGTHKGLMGVVAGAALAAGGTVVGVVVDGVSDVVPLASEQVRPTPEFGAAVDTRYISGIGTINDRMLILLDIESLVLSAVVAGVEPAAAA